MSFVNANDTVLNIVKSSESDADYVLRITGISPVSMMLQRQELIEAMEAIAKCEDHRGSLMKRIARATIDRVSGESVV